MSHRSHTSSTVSLFATICLVSFIWGCVSTYGYITYKDTNPARANRDYDELIVSWVIFPTSYWLMVCSHRMNTSPEKCLPVLV